MTSSPCLNSWSSRCRSGLVGLATLVSLIDCVFELELALDKGVESFFEGFDFRGNGVEAGFGHAKCNLGFFLSTFEVIDFSFGGLDFLIEPWTGASDINHGLIVGVFIGVAQ